MTRQSWVPIIIWAGFIYAGLPVARQFTQPIREAGYLGWMVAFLLGAIVLAALALLGRRRDKIKLKQWVLAAITLSAGAILTARLHIPEERLHYFQYGILGLLLYRKIQAIMPALVLGALWGVGDEFIQGLLPSRVFEWRDILLNVEGVALGLGLALSVDVRESPETPEPKSEPKVDT